MPINVASGHIITDCDSRMITPTSTNTTIRDQKKRQCIVQPLLVSLEKGRQTADNILHERLQKSVWKSKGSDRHKVALTSIKLIISDYSIVSMSPSFLFWMIKYVAIKAAIQEPQFKNFRCTFV